MAPVLTPDYWPQRLHSGTILLYSPLILDWATSSSSTKHPEIHYCTLKHTHTHGSSHCHNTCTWLCTSVFVICNLRVRCKTAHCRGPGLDHIYSTWHLAQSIWKAAPVLLYIRCISKQSPDPQTVKLNRSLGELSMQPNMWVWLRGMDIPQIDRMLFTISVFFVLNPEIWRKSKKCFKLYIFVPCWYFLWLLLKILLYSPPVQ